jgi:hypothetical protein
LSHFLTRKIPNIDEMISENSNVVCVLCVRP